MITRLPSSPALFLTLCLSALPVVTALPVRAQEGTSVPAASPMTGAEFDAFSRGKTFYYGTNGAAYGVEEYLPDQRVRWSFLDGDCQDGRWFEEAGNICFVYEGTPDPQCWAFYLQDGQLTATFQGEGSQTVLYQIQDADQPMQCKGPEVGV